MSGRPKTELVLSDSERDQLRAFTMPRKTAQALAVESAHRAGLCRRD
jgi:hypothetical protein